MITCVSRVVVALAIVGGISVAALASTDPGGVIKGRRALMKANGEGAKVIGAMLDGSAPFDAAKATAAATAMAKAGHGFSADFAANFADGSQTGDTKASPDIWTNKDEFTSKAAALESDANATVTAAGQSEDAFKVAAGRMFGNCKGCHEKYKLK